MYVLLMHAKVVQILAKNYIAISVNAGGPNISLEIFDPPSLIAILVLLLY